MTHHARALRTGLGAGLRAGLRTGLIALAAAAGVVVFGAMGAQPANAAQIVSADSQRLDLETNKGTLIRLDRPASDIFIANPEVADIQVKSPKLLYIFGKAQGETTLYALDANEEPLYSATVVVTRNLARLNATLKEMLPDTRIDVRNIGGMLVLSGTVASAEQAEEAEQYARVITGGGEMVNKIKILQPTQVNLRVKIAEVGRSVIKDLGFNWENLFTGSNSFFGFVNGRNVFDLVPDPFNPATPIREFVLPTDTNSFVGNVTAGNFDLNFVIDALEQENFLTVLAEPNLTAISGETARFLAGGEFPVPVPDDGNIAIDYQEFGVGLNFTPIVLSSGRISLRVAPEVSELSNTGAISVNSITVPALATRRAETTVELGSGQSFAIAGLLQSSLTQDVQKYPWLADVPVLGALFKSDRFVRDETELVIVVTPYLVRPVSERRLALPTDGLLAPNDLDRYLRGETLRKQPRRSQPAAAEQSGPSLVGRAGFKLN